jgi:DNA-binding MarR family transcriptional regulator
MVNQLTSVGRGAVLGSTSHLLFALNQAQRGELTGRLAGLGLHPGAVLALAHVWREEGITLSQLADRLGMTRASVTKLARGLEEAGYVQRMGDPGDGRVTHLHSTGAGRRVRPQIERAWRNAERQSLGALTQDEMATLRRLLSTALGGRR